MDVREIREMDDGVLQDAIEDKRNELFQLRFQRAAGQLEDVNLPRYARRDLAQLLTVRRERQLAAALVAAEEE